MFDFHPLRRLAFLGELNCSELGSLQNFAGLMDAEVGIDQLVEGAEGRIVDECSDLR